MLDGVDASTPRHRQELDALRAWDGVESIDSRPALVFQVWVRRHLRPRLLDLRLEREGLDPERRAAVAPLVLKDESFGGDLRGDLRLLDWARREVAPAELAAMLDRTLETALDDIAERCGAESDDAPWRWGDIHHSSVTHPAFATRAGEVPAEWVRHGPLPRAGSGDTVGMAGYDSTFRQSIGSTFRMVIDVGSWDDSVALNSPGQSGDPRSSHYADLFAPWVAGETFPLAYSRAMVERHAAARIRLVPSAR
jgi:penicillin G amidase